MSKNINLVSVIITTRNEEAVVEDILKSILAQSFKQTEIIVVDNSSEDKTIEIARKYTSNVFTFGPERSSQRNYGAKHAKGVFLLFLDADMRLSKDVIRECVSVIKTDPKIGGVVIPEKSIAKSYWEKVKAFERSFYNLEGDETVDAARFFSKKAFLSVNGYDESITGPEDWDLPETIKRKGYLIKRVKAVIYHHERVKNLQSLVKKKFYYGIKSSLYLEKQNIPVLSSKTIYFLRPVFYKNWKRMIENPILSIGMLVMFISEIIGGGMGYFIGKFVRK